METGISVEAAVEEGTGEEEEVQASPVSPASPEGATTEDKAILSNLFAALWWMSWDGDQSLFY